MIVVGGGSILVQGDLEGANSVHKPAHFLVANAIGAAIAQVSGEVDQIFPSKGKPRNTRSIAGVLRKQFNLAVHSKSRHGI